MDAGDADDVTVKVVLAKAPVVAPFPPIECAPVGEPAGMVTAMLLKSPLALVVGVPSTVVLVHDGMLQSHRIFTVSKAPYPVPAMTADEPALPLVGLILRVGTTLNSASAKAPVVPPLAPIL